MSNVMQLPKPEPKQGMLDIYRARHGMRGLDAMLPVDLADHIIRLIREAGVPVRYEAPEDLDDFALHEMPGGVVAKPASYYAPRSSSRGIHPETAPLRPGGAWGLGGYARRPPRMNKVSPVSPGIALNRETGAKV